MCLMVSRMAMLVVPQGAPSSMHMALGHARAKILALKRGMLFKKICRVELHPLGSAKLGPITKLANSLGLRRSSNRHLLGPPLGPHGFMCGL